MRESEDGYWFTIVLTCRIIFFIISSSVYASGYLAVKLCLEKPSSDLSDSFPLSLTEMNIVISHIYMVPNTDPQNYATGMAGSSGVACEATPANSL